jgi:glutamate-1-semialdehyde 2,1-aminomutase
VRDEHGKGVVGVSVNLGSLATYTKEILEKARTLYSVENPNSHALYVDACNVFPGGNTRTALFYTPFPLTMVRGEGAYLWDADGHKYTDLLGDFTAGLFGHSSPLIRSAIDRALGIGVNLGAHNALQACLGELICSRFPSIELVRFTNSGTEANLMALSAACAITRRPKLMVFEGSYHGSVFSFSGPNNPLNTRFQYIVGRYNDVAHTRELLFKHGSDIAAVILEPMLGSGGCIPADICFLQQLREVTMRYGIILIFDEVMTSRLSPGGLQEYFGVIPDMTTLGKYVGGGMSFGAFGGRKEIMMHFDVRFADSFPHSGTFNNNILTMSAGLAGMTAYTAELAKLHNATGDKLRSRLNALTRKKRVRMQFTGLGSMLSMHMQDQHIHGPYDTVHEDQYLRELFFFDLVAKGVWLGRNGMMSLSLPVGEAECDILAHAVEEFIDARHRLLTQ